MKALPGANMFKGGLFPSPTGKEGEDSPMATNKWLHWGMMRWIALLYPVDYVLFRTKCASLLFWVSLGISGSGAFSLIGLRFNEFYSSVDG
jgi:hypothetical protein